MYKRNPDEAEEDDIGPSEPSVQLQRSTRRRGSLLIELRRYYHANAAIPHHKRKRAKEIVEDIKSSLQMYLNLHKDHLKTPYTFGSIMPQGSNYEGLKVIEPIEFDLLLPLMLKDSDWNYTEWQNEDVVKSDDKDQAPGYFFIKKIRRHITTNTAIVSDVYLRPIKIQREMQSTVQKAVNKMNLSNVQRVTLQQSGPALTLEVRYDNSQRMSIDIVPSIKLRDKLDNNKYRLFIAKRHPKADQYQSPSPCRNDHNIYNRIWRESFSEEEKMIIREMDAKHECRRACLKILKTIRLSNGKSQLRMLSSYHLKTCMMHLNADINIGPWHQDKLDDRFKDLLRKLIQYLNDGKMPSYFSPTVDLFTPFNGPSLQNVSGWLRRVMRSDDTIIDELLSNSMPSEIILTAYWLAINKMYKRNPDEAEEDDIGASESSIQPESSIRRRGSLLIELRRYYHDYAAIPHHKRKRAREIVEDIKCSLQMHLDLHKNDPKTPYTFGNIMPQGSSYEGLEVIEPNEFDLLLPLMLKDSDWNYTELPQKNVVKSNDKDQAPGYFFINKTRCHFITTNTAIVNTVYLCPIKIQREMQSTVQKAVNKMDLSNVQRVTMQQSGPALTLEVRYDNSQRMSIDIVASIKLRDKLDNNKYRLFVAKRHPKADHQLQNIYNASWRESFSEYEKLIIREMDGKHECRRACLKILKTIRLRNKSCPLAMLSSYHLKTCMLYLNDDIYRPIESWRQNHLDDCFKDLVWKLIQYLDDEEMPSFFAPTVDLFTPFEESSLQNVSGWLRRVMRSDDTIIDELLSDRNKAWLSTHRNFDGEDEDDIGSVYADGSLLSELRSFYYKHAAIETKKRKAASSVVEEIIEQFQNYTRDASKHEFGSIIRQGSSYEGLKVIEPDEFDLLIPLKIYDVTIKGAKGAPGYYFICYDGVDSGNIWQKCIVDGFLNPVLVSREMQSVIQHAINFMTRQLPDYVITMRESGPAKTLNVKYKNGTIDIDLVPSVALIGGEYLVAKRHRRADHYQSKDPLCGNKCNHIWRMSFSEKEKSVIQNIDKTHECHRACLKILKTVAVKTCQSRFGMLSSYHLKTCLLHLSRRNVGSWHQDNLDDRFKDLVNILIEFLEAKRLPSFFDESVDLFEPFSPPALTNLKRWLQRKTGDDDVIMRSLLAEQYGTEAQCAANSSDSGIDWLTATLIAVVAAVFFTMALTISN